VAPSPLLVENRGDKNGLIAGVTLQQQVDDEVAVPLRILSGNRIHRRSYNAQAIWLVLRGEGNIAYDEGGQRRYDRVRTGSYATFRKNQFFGFDFPNGGDVIIGFLPDITRLTIDYHDFAGYPPK
jgi:hypothetical protein